MLSTPSNYFSSLQQLRFDAANQTADTKNQTIEETAIQFESLFINEMLKTMRDSINQSDLFGSDAVQQYTEMYDQQLSVHLAKQGFGLKEMIIQQLGGHTETGEWQSKQDFIADIEHALDQTLPASFDKKAVLAISALETGWGKHVIKDNVGNSSFNLFNIKANNHWQGEKVYAPTQEYINNHFVTQHEPFRAYQSIENAINDFVSFIDQPRYQQAKQQSQNGLAFLQSIADAGYATDPSYADKLINIYKSL